MFKYSLSDIEVLSKNTGFIKDTIEKVLRLEDVLVFFNTDERIKGKLAIKGGTAINLIFLDLPRLSVDIDLDYTINNSKIEMKKERAIIDLLIKSFMLQEGYELSKESKFYHSLDSYSYAYKTQSHANDKIKIEINYSDRCHILPTSELQTTKKMCNPISLLSLNRLEVIGSKINALIVRTTPRDVYDTYNLIKNNVFSSEEEIIIRKIAIFYICLGSENKNGFTEIVNKSINVVKELTFSIIKSTIIPVLSRNEKVDLGAYKETVLPFLEKFRELNENEIKFIDLFFENEYKPSLLFGDKIAKNIENHPMAIWKTMKKTK